MTLDLATRRPPAVLALFDELSLVEAMKRDVCLSAALTAARSRPPTACIPRR